MEPLKRELRVGLSDKERIFLRKIVTERIVSPSRIRRAEILLSLDTSPVGRNIAQIAALYRVTPDTVNRIFSRYHKYGLRTAVLATRLPQYVVLSDSERLLLHGILNDPKSTKRNAKVARILLRAEADGENADATQIVNSLGGSITTVVRTLQLYKKSGLENLLDRPPRPFMLCFQLSAKDRKTLSDLLKQKLEQGWKRNRILVLLKSDQFGPNVNLRNISELTGVSTTAIRRTCTNYVESGLEVALSYRISRPEKSRRPFQVRLSAEEQKRLQRLLKGSCSKRVKQRAIVLLNADANTQDKSSKEIKAIAGVCEVTISRICKWFVRHGLEYAIFGRPSDRLPPKVKTKQKPRTGASCGKIGPIPLKSLERFALQKVLAEKTNAKGRIKRAQILLKIDEFGSDKSFREIAELVGVSDQTVSHTYRRYLKAGIYHAIDHKQMLSPTRVSLLNDKQEDRIVKLFEGSPPKDCVRWTFKILAEQAVARKIVHAISRETVRKVLRKRRVVLHR